MAQILLKQAGQPVADFAVAGAVITIAGIIVDCAERQNDGTVIVEIRRNANGAGVGGSGAYLAQITIPARRYAMAEADRGKPPVAVPLDPNAIEITLWPAV